MQAVVLDVGGGKCRVTTQRWSGITDMDVSRVYSLTHFGINTLLLQLPIHQRNWKAASPTRSIENRSRGFPVAEHFNSTSHSLDDIMVCGLKQCTGSNTSCKQHEMKSIFKLQSRTKVLTHLIKTNTFYRRPPVIKKKTSFLSITNPPSTPCQC